MIASAHRKRRILFVIADMGVGGAQKQVAEVMNRLDPERFETDIVCLETGGINLDRLKRVGDVHILNAPRIYDNNGAAALGRLVSIVRRGRYDVVETYLAESHFLCSLALIGKKRPALVASRRHMASLDPLWMSAVRPILNAVTRFSIANSRAVKDSVVRRYGLQPSKVAVIPNVVEERATGSGREAARASLGIPRGSVVVAAAGTMSPVKDYPTIVRAFAQVRAEDARAVLVVAGDGKMREAVAGLAKGLGLNGEARFLGNVSDVGEVLAAADVFVHASKTEGLSNAVLEAMAAGLPVVSSDIPASREALGRDCGVFFAPGDWRACAEGLKSFARDGAAAAAHGAKGRERVRKAYSDAVIRRRERLYTRLSETGEGK